MRFAETADFLRHGIGVPCYGISKNWVALNAPCLTPAGGLLACRLRHRTFKHNDPAFQRAGDPHKSDLTVKACHRDALGVDEGHNGSREIRK